MATRSIDDARERARRRATEAVRGDAGATVRALVSASERMAIGEAMRARRDAAKGRERDDGRARAASGVGECSIGEGGIGVGERGVDAPGMRATTTTTTTTTTTRDERDERDEDEDEDEETRERLVEAMCARVEKSRAEIGLDAFDFAEGSRGAETISESGLEDALAQVEYSSGGWETAPEARSQHTLGTASVGASGRPMAPCAMVSDVFSQLEGGEEEVRARGADAKEDDEEGASTESEDDAYVGGTQAYEDVEDEAIAGTQVMEDLEAEFVGGTQVPEEEEPERVDEEVAPVARTPPRKDSPAAFMRIASASIELPERASGKKENASPAEGSARQPMSPPRPKSLWAAAAATPTEERARRESSEAAKAREASTSIPPVRSDANDRGALDGRVECTPLDDVIDPPSKPPALKRPGVLAGRTQDSSMVTASARALGSIDTQREEGRGVVNTAIEAVRRAREQQRQSLGVDMSMPRNDFSQLVDEENEDHDDDDVVEATPENVLGDAGDAPESPPSSPDIGLFYSQRPADEYVDSPQRPQTQQSQSPLKAQPPPPPPLSQPEVESPRSRILLSQHQWRQPRRRAPPPPPPRFDDETPSKRVRIIDDDLSQSMTQTQPTQDYPSQGDFVDFSQRDSEGGLLRPRITSIPAPTFAQRVPAEERVEAPSPPRDGDERTPSKEQEDRPLPTLGCPKCRHSKGGCGRCRTILENAKKGIWPRGRGRSKKSSVDSVTTSARTTSRRTSGRTPAAISKTPASKTPTSKMPIAKTPATKASTSKRMSTATKQTKPGGGARSRTFSSLHFLLSGVGKSSGALKETIRAHGGTVLDEPSPDVSVNSIVVVTPKMGRTMKCLYGVAAGARFAKPSWIDACAEERRILDVDEPLDAEGKPRERHRACSRKLFRDVTTAITGNEGFVKDFTSLLAHAGAALESNPQTDRRFDFLITQSGEKPHSAWIRSAKRLGAPCIRHEWLVESILAGELLDVSDFAADASVSADPPSTDRAARRTRQRLH